MILPPRSVNGIRDLVRQVAYLNTREFPAPGQRLLRLSTQVRCRDGRTMPLPDRRSTVTVAPTQEPKIDITGTRDIDREYEDFKLGVRIFADVHIVMTTGSPENGGFIFAREQINLIKMRCSANVAARKAIT